MRKLNAMLTPLILQFNDIKQIQFGSISAANDARYQEERRAA